ncbi:MAG: ribonuclease HII [Pseudomonadota bacterium]
MTAPDFSLEDRIGARVAGLDEAGRGPWAGPVVAAAVILNHSALPPGLNDSKKLSPRRRDALYDQIVASAEYGIGIADVAEIDSLNILRANDLAMRRAVEGIDVAHVLIDGNRVPPEFPLPATAVVKGDGRSLSIAAASVLAKVTRDRIMDDLARVHPGYGWETNRGYGTAAHALALKNLGITPHHRRSFRPVHNMLC